MKIKTALILCAGFGKRLNPLTLKKPKPLIKLNNITLLENTINLIKKLGINKILINTFYLQDQISNFVREKKFNISINIVPDGEKILNTGGGIKNMISNSKENDFIVFNPDTIWNVNYLEPIIKMGEYYERDKIKNILLVTNKKLSFDEKLKGDFNLEKNLLSKNLNNKYIYTGCQIINRNLLDNNQKIFFSINEIWKDLIKNNTLFGFNSANKFYHITDLKVYNELSKGY